MTTYKARCTNGIFEHVRTVSVSKKLKYLPYAQAGIRVISPNCVQLVSYETVVIEIDRGWLFVNGLYSMTTRRHISAFVKEWLPGLTYRDIKNLYENGQKLNIHTGEIALDFETVTTPANIPTVSFVA